MNFTVIYSTNDSSGHATSTISQFDLIFFLIPKGLLCLCQIKTLEVIMEYKHEDKMIILHQITFIWQTRLSNLEWSIDCFVPKMYIIYTTGPEQMKQLHFWFLQKRTATQSSGDWARHWACVCVVSEYGNTGSSDFRRNKWMIADECYILWHFQINM